MVQDKRKKTDRAENADGSRPLVSVIMPAYNAERTIAGAINSILTQTYQNWELIIIDDGSQDNTQREIQKFQNPRIRYYNIGHRGIVKSRNYGNSKAQGKFCVVQDADDYSMPDRIEKIVKLFLLPDNQRPDVIVHGAYINAWNEQYGCMERRYSPPLSGKQNALENRINGWPAYKREVWVKKPFRKETQFYYDYMMHADWTLSGFKYATLNEGLYDYIRYQGSASDRFEREGKREICRQKAKEIILKEYGETTRYGNDGQLQ